MRAFAGLLLLLALLTGCTDPGATVALREWTLSGADGATSALSLPAHVDRLLRKEHQRYRLHRAVALDPALRGRPLVLVIPRLLARVTLKVDGVEVRSLEDSDPDGYRTRGPHAFHIPARETARDAIDLELDVDHTWTQSGWLDTVPRLTSASEGGTAFVWQRTFNDVTVWLALGFALFAGYLYLVVFLTDVRRVTFFWFGVTGLGGCLYPLFETGVAARLLGPWETTAAAVGVSTAVVTQVHFTHAEFRVGRPHRGWDVAWAASSLAAVASTGYFTGTRIGGATTVLLTIPAVFTQVRLFARLWRKRPRPVNLFLVLSGWVVLALLGLPDFVAWGGLGELLGGTRPACFAIVVIAVLQTAALSREHTSSLRKAEGLAREREERIRLLESRNREVEVLNDELRRQIGARSRVLADALSRESGVVEERVLKEGDVVEDRYTVIRVLGEGAAGTVYLVERRADAAQLAMKVVRGTSDRQAVARLAREAQLATEVKHENVIRVVDVDVAHTGFLYVVMEYVAGASLREHRAEYGRASWSVDILGQIAAGLASVHERGIVHRDLKPANILLVPRGEGSPLVKIADFGIAGVASRGRRESLDTLPDRKGLNALDSFEATAPITVPEVEADLRLTQTGMLLGTPLYMAPEACEGAKSAAPPSDMFSFGVIAYEVLTGAAPFAESPALALLQGLSVAPPATIAEVRPGLSPAVISLVDRCLSFEAERRPTAAEARDVLVGASRGVARREETGDPLASP